MLLILMECGIVFAKVKECLDAYMGSLSQHKVGERALDQELEDPDPRPLPPCVIMGKSLMSVGPRYPFHKILEIALHLIFAQIPPSGVQSIFMIHHLCSSPTS